MAAQSFWTPQLEAKLHAWHTMQQVADRSTPAPCFTISREFGCEAYPLAEKLIERLNARVAGNPWVVVGRELLDEVSKLSGYSVEQIERSQNTTPSLKAIFSMFLDGSHAEETEVFTHMRDVIREFARCGHCVLIGRGSVLATQDLPNCIHLRLVAPYDYRVQKIMRSHNLTEREAQEYIALHQQQRDDFVRRFADGNIADSSHYHLVINNGFLNVDKIAELAEEYMIRYGS